MEDDYREVGKKNLPEMQTMTESPLLFESPSFNSYYGDRLAETAAKVAEEFITESSQARHHDTEEELDHPYPTLPQSLNDQQPQQQENDDDDDDDDDDEDDDFEFAVIGRDPEFSPIHAEEIFCKGVIRPMFPVFNRDLLLADGNGYDSKPPKNPSSLRSPLRKLMIEEPENDNPPSSSSSEDELEGIPDEIYCVWKPKPVEASPDRCKKSKSTGSTKRSWKFRDLLYRSHSEGMNHFVYLTPPKTSTKRSDKTEKVANSEPVQKAEPHRQQRQTKVTSNSISRQVNVAGKGKVKVKKVSGEPLSAHEIHYVRYRALKEDDRRRSYLPYRQDLVGLFANANGHVTRNHHPF